MLKTDRTALVNSAVWHESSASDPVFGEQTVVDHALEGIRISESTNGITYSADGEARSTSIVLFFFVGASTVDGKAELPGWARGQKVTLEGEERVIKGIRRHWDRDRLHHLEVILE